jgi:hypothetical protein
MKTLPQPWIVPMDAKIFSGSIYDHLPTGAADGVGKNRVSGQPDHTRKILIPFRATENRRHRSSSMEQFAVNTVACGFPRVFQARRVCCFGHSGSTRQPMKTLY